MSQDKKKLSVLLQTMIIFPRNMLSQKETAILKLLVLTSHTRHPQTANEHNFYDLFLPHTEYTTLNVTFDIKTRERERETDRPRGREREREAHQRKKAKPSWGP